MTLEALAEAFDSSPPTAQPDFELRSLVSGGGSIARPHAQTIRAKDEERKKAPSAIDGAFAL
jgi:hypothetical protein